MVSKIARFVILYYSHILTTVPIPLAMLLLGWVTPVESLGLVLLIAGFWTLVGAFFMFSKDVRLLKKLYTFVGVALVLVSALLLLVSLP